ncbi:hypothetical protein JHV675_53660 [Mycobacterium avium subsp. hominissuis]
MKVKDSGAVVVGGASGMGRATAERLAERGARVAPDDHRAAVLDLHANLNPLSRRAVLLRGHHSTHK